MLTLATAMTVAVPLLLVSDERSLFYIPGPEDVRFQKISRTGNEKDWPFTVDDGTLSCVWSGGQKIVQFIETVPDDLDEHEVEGYVPDMVFVSSNPFDITLLNIGSRHLIVQVDTVEELIERMAPFERLGRRLCDQPRGTDIGPGEL
ncbi:hypothetical protein [Mesorhizobium sp. CAU 1732]|uniref:hypothetical protein n=1 Tax=Mesorhizobium sp. CAU 1732 TaxID=3140358 RepID=UPI0032604EA8